MNALPIEMSIFGRNVRMVEVLFADDVLVTVSRDSKGYHVAGGMASASSAYSSIFGPAEPHAIAATQIARTYI